jgi:hypothetical protein
VDAVESALDAFERGDVDVERFQSMVEPLEARLDNSTPQLLAELRRLDAELERIRFTVLASRQRDEALALLAKTREILRSTRAAT